MDSSLINPSSAVGLLVPPLVLFIFLMMKIYCKKKSEAPINLLLPPGPKRLAIIGNLHLISLPAFRCLRDLAEKYGPIMYLQLGQVPVIVVSSPEVAKEILKDNDPIFADRLEGLTQKMVTNNYIDIAFGPYGDYWKQMRKICMVELLSAKNVRSFGSIRNDEVSRLIESIRASSGKPVNLTEKTYSLISAITARAAFGKACKDSDAFVASLKEVLDMAAGYGMVDLFPSSKIINTLMIWTKLRLKKIISKFNGILDDIINEHKQNLAAAAEDLVDVLLRIKESKELQFPIGDDNIKVVLLDMFAAGTDTSAATIEWTMTELIRNPRVMAKAQAEVRRVLADNNMGEEHVGKLKYLKLVIKESLRLHPPGAMIPRTCRQECKISGYTIPARVKVLVNVWAMQRDPKYWTDPESFQPERFEINQSIDFTGGDHFEYLPFGSGKRMCPGITFGLASVELPLAQLLYNFDWKLPDGVEAQDLDMSERIGLVTSRKENLFLVPTPYEPLL